MARFLRVLSLSSQQKTAASHACVVPTSHCCQLAVVPLEMPNPIKLKLKSQPQRSSQGSSGLILGASQIPTPQRTIHVNSRIVFYSISKIAFDRHDLLYFS